MAVWALQVDSVSSLPSWLVQALDGQGSLKGISWGISQLHLPVTCSADRLPVFQER